MLSSYLYLKSFQVATLEQMLSTENETDLDPQQFHNWEGKGAAKILLPDVWKRRRKYAFLWIGNIFHDEIYCND